MNNNDSHFVDYLENERVYINCYDEDYETANE